MESRNTENNDMSVNLDEKITVRSIAPWATGAKRILSIGDIQVQPNGVVSITRGEAIAQGQSGNRLLTGVDGVGNHATWYIDDEYTRKELGFEAADSKQRVVSDDVVKKAFEIKTEKAFERFIEENFVTKDERAYLISKIKSLKIIERSSYPRIAFCEKLSGCKL